MFAGLMPQTFPIFCLVLVSPQRRSFRAYTHSFTNLKRNNDASHHVSPNTITNTPILTHPPTKSHVPRPSHFGRQPDLHRIEYGGEDAKSE